MPNKAEVEAESLFEDFALDLPVCPISVCDSISTAKHPVTYSEVDFTSQNICGISIGGTKETKIIVNKNISNNGRKLFTSAHEIGHVILHIQTGKNSSFECTESDINCKNQNTLKYEREANNFASSLLLPSSYIIPIVRRNDITWSLVEEVANKCSTSLEATARRLVNSSYDRTALVIHKDGKMWTPVKSRSFPLYINSLEVLPPLITYDDTNKFPEHLDTCLLNELIDSSGNQGGMLSYSSIFNREYNRRMTLITLLEFEEDDESEWDAPKF
ncbi:ImmA/IrrE family metallo-endopeptidase [Amphritea atlantica]|uniref:ImmA/IrrE family metallo-endopeptidase n=1 Tax=Amphritea atlantica TaxID=355243 RepID=A0ABY5GTE2_9GAMM|nr:ImmA/IrrE family metallo-endopeptidase [Amphritea atlantica]